MKIITEKFNGICFDRGTITFGHNKQTGWQFQLYFPKIEMEHKCDADYTKTCVCGFNVQLNTALRIVFDKHGETVIGLSLLGFGAAAQYVSQ